MNQREDNDLNDENSQERNEDDEVLVVPLADACSQPRTVMIQSFYAAVAYSTMYGSWRSVDLTCLAVLDLGKTTVDDV